MEHPRHDIMVQVESSPRHRYIGYAIVGLLHVAFVWALVSGLAMRIVQTAPKLLTAEVLAPEHKAERVSVPKPMMVVPKDAIPPPQIQIETAPQRAITVQTGGAPAASTTAVAKGIDSTHTTPPYPGDARDRGQHGVVTLHILVSATGQVTNAIVTKSSGVPILDQTAVSWVIAHWKYRPAMQNGVAVASSADANVVFDLRNG